MARDGTKIFDWGGRGINFQYIKVTYKNKISFNLILALRKTKGRVSC